MKNNLPVYRLNRSAGDRGNVLVLVVVVLGLLALLGGVYLQTARVQRRVFVDADDISLTARDIAVQEITQILKDDIFNPVTGVFLDYENGTEALDKPWTNDASQYDVFDVAGNDIGDARGSALDDTWLASPTPFLQGGEWRWRQISTLNGTWFATNAAPSVDIADRQLNAAQVRGDDPTDWYGNGGTLRQGIDFNIPAFTDPTLVDADGDGMPDSRLQRIDGFASNNGLEYFTAIRIIDLSSLLNLNTAASSLQLPGGNFDTTAIGTDAPQSESPTEVNLGTTALDAIFDTNVALESSIFDEVNGFNRWRDIADSSILERREHWKDAASRLGVPGPSATATRIINLLEDVDEVELRYRGGAFDFEERSSNVDKPYLPTAAPDIPSGIQTLLGQGLYDPATAGIESNSEAGNFFTYIPTAVFSAPNARVRFTTASGEALFTPPLPRESLYEGAVRQLQVPLNDDRLKVVFDYPPASDAAVAGRPPLKPFASNHAFAPGQDAVAAMAPIPARPASNIVDSARAMTEVAAAVRDVYNVDFTTTKAVAANEPNAGGGTVPPADPGNTETPVLFGDRVAAGELDVNLFATQFAASLKDYVDADNLLTVLDANGMLRPDDDQPEQPYDTHVFPLGNGWSNTDTSASGLNWSPPTTPNPRVGFEAFPYISEVYVQANYEINSTTSPPVVSTEVIPGNAASEPDYDVTWDRVGNAGYAIEIRNPFNYPISLSNVHLTVGPSPGLNDQAGTAGEPLGITPTTPLAERWDTSSTVYAVALPTADAKDADFDGDQVRNDFDLADLVTHALQASTFPNPLASDVRKDTLEPNEVLILYRNSNQGAGFDADEDQIVNADAAPPILFDDGEREPNERQFDGAEPDDSLIRDDSVAFSYAAGDYTYTYVPVDFVWPGHNSGSTSDPDAYKGGSVTVELSARLADDSNGFTDATPVVGVVGGTLNNGGNLPEQFRSQRIQVVDTSVATPASYLTTMTDFDSAAATPGPAAGSTVVMQHSTVGSGNQLNTMLMRRTDFATRHVFPDDFDRAAAPADVQNNDLADLLDTGLGTPENITRADVRGLFDGLTSPAIVGARQDLLGEADKSGAPGYTTQNNDYITTTNQEQVIVRNAPLSSTAEVAGLLLMGIETVRAGSEGVTGSTADSFFNNQVGPTAIPDSFDYFRLNFGENPAIPLPATSNQITALPAAANSPLDIPHATFLLNRFTVVGPQRDGIDNDGDGLVDALDSNEQTVAGRLNINGAQPELIRSALPFADATLRGTMATAITTERNDALLTAAPQTGLDTVWRMLNPIAAVVPNAQALADDNQRDAANTARIDFLLNELPTSDDGIENDTEERYTFLGALPQVATTRSDVFVAYILVQGYRDADGDGSFATAGEPEDGLIEQTRSIVLFDRSKMVNSSDPVEARVLYTFPK